LRNIDILGAEAQVSKVEISLDYNDVLLYDNHEPILYITFTIDSAEYFMRTCYSNKLSP
jgi:hypothetical protein